MAANVPLSHVVHLPILGVETAFASNAPSALEAIQAVYGHWAALFRVDGLVSPSPAIVRVRVRVRETSTTTRPLQPVRCQAADARLMTVEWPGGQGRADSNRRAALVHVNDGNVAASADFVEAVIEPLVLFLLGGLDRTPLHTSCIVRNGSALLLAGRSGTGKSTLAYAALRNGFSLLADEPAYVQTRPVLRIWGRRARIHLNRDVARFFDELTSTPAQMLATGKTKMVIDLPGHTRYAECPGICVLERVDGKAPELERISAEQAMLELGDSLEPGYQLFADDIQDRLRRIAERGAWRLRMGESPFPALPLLDAVCNELAGRR